jgi:hypothetical protein
MTTKKRQKKPPPAPPAPRPAPPPPMDAPRRSALLSTLAELAERRFGWPLTVSVGGTMITGFVTSSEEYFTAMGAVIGKGIADQFGDKPELAGLATAFFADRHEEASRDAGDFIYMQEARFLQPGAASAPTWICVRLASVDAFHLGVVVDRSEEATQLLARSREAEQRDDRREALRLWRQAVEALLEPHAVDESGLDAAELAVTYAPTRLELPHEVGSAYEAALQLVDRGRTAAQIRRQQLRDLLDLAKSG